MLEALLRMNRAIDVRHVLPAVRVPTLVIHGSEDQFVPTEAARYLADQIPGARFIELAGVGHLALEHGAAAISGEVERFLTDVFHGGGLAAGRA